MKALKWGLLSSRSPMISDRLAALVRTVLIAFGGLLVAYVAVTAFTTLRVNSQRDLGTFALNLAHVQFRFLEMRYKEKEFQLRRVKKEFDEHGQAYEKVLAAAREARNEPLVTAEERQQLDTVTQAIEVYRRVFIAAAEGQFALGENENSGLQGALRKAAHDAEEIALAQNLSELEVGILTLRRHEKDFILREREEHVTKHAKELAEVKKLVAGSKIDSGTRQRLDERLSAYDKAFKEFVAGTVALGMKYKQARDEAKVARDLLPKLLATVDERRKVVAVQVPRIQTGSVVGVALALALVGWLVWRNLGSMRRSITASVNSLQSAIQSVRDGAGLGALAKIETKDELGEVGFGVNQLLQAQISQREQAEVERKKAEAANERLNNSVISILQAVNLLSHRDLTARAPVTNDVIGTVSDSINALTDETSKVLKGVTQIAGQVQEVSGKLKVQSDLVSKTAADERISVNQMIESIGEADKTTNQVAALAEQSNRSAEQATQVTDSALETVNGTVKGMESIRETIAETEKRIKRLGERSQEISGIVNLINTISERTHVLALNASMQAAVAGEAGRGFAVVAEEVQRLAESSRNATQQIATLVNNIQLETNETISTVNRTIGQVVQGSEQAQRAGEQMRRTQQITGQLVAQVQRIAASSEQQKTVSAQLLKAVQHIGASTDRTAQQIAVQNQDTDSLLVSARRLVESVAVFKLPQVA